MPQQHFSVMNKTSKDQLRRFTVAFYDDILGYSCSLEVHKKHIEEVLSSMRQHQLCAKRRKCPNLGEYLSTYIISKIGIKIEIDSKKIENRLHWPRHEKILRVFKIILTSFSLRLS